MSTRTFFGGPSLGLMTCSASSISHLLAGRLPDADSPRRPIEHETVLAHLARSWVQLIPELHRHIHLLRLDLPDLGLPSLLLHVLERELDLLGLGPCLKRLKARVRDHPHLEMGPVDHGIAAAVARLGHVDLP